MKSRSNPLVTQYLKEVSEKIVCPKGTKRFFLCELEQEVFAFAEENPELTAEMIYQAFGVPENFANNIADQECYMELYKKAKKKATIWKWIGIGIGILALVMLLYFVRVINKVEGKVFVTNPSDSASSSLSTSFN